MLKRRARTRNANHLFPNQLRYHQPVCGSMESHVYASHIGVSHAIA